MTKKVYQLVAGILGAAEAAAIALVTYFEPTNATAINASIVIGCTAVLEICAQFMTEEPASK